jgi:hypothetical protein
MMYHLFRIVRWPYDFLMTAIGDSDSGKEMVQAARGLTWLHTT